MPFLKGPRHDRRRRRRSEVVPIVSNGYEVVDSAYARLYGPGLHTVDYLSNICIGRPDGISTWEYTASWRFRAAYSGNITSIRPFLTDGVGYAAGNGGTLRIRIFPDDGTANHRPDLNATALSSGSFTFDMTAGSFNVSTIGYEERALSASSAAVAGNLYHVYFDNTDADPEANYVSIDCCVGIPANGHPNQWLSPWDWGVLYALEYSPFSGDLSWTEWTATAQGGYYNIPSMQINYAGGEKQGNSNMETGNIDTGLAPGDGSQYPWRPTASLPVRERFTPTTTKKVIGVSVHTAKESGSGGLTWEIKNGSTVMASGVIADPGNDYTTSDSVGVFSWRHVTLNTPVILDAAGTYDLVFTPISTSVWVFSDQRNGGEFGWVSPAAFTESQAEHWNGSTWLGAYHWDHADDGVYSNWRVVLHLA